MAIIAITDRRSLLDWLAEDAELKSQPLGSFASLAGDLSGERVALIWGIAQTGPNDKPGPVIVVPDDSVYDFLAWASTYIQTYAPFTAFFRVITVSEAQLFEINGAGRSSCPDSLLVSLAAVVVAEAVIQMPSPTRSLSDVSIQSCQATFSYAVARALANGFHPADLPKLADKWSVARNITADSRLRLDIDDSTLFWMLAADSLISAQPDFKNAESTWAEEIGDLIQTERLGRPAEETAAWRHLRSYLPRSNDTLRLFDAPREDQLLSLDETAASLLTSPAPRPLIAAWVGMLAARLANGSFDYLGVLDRVRDQLPASLLWFALFSTFRPGFDGLISGRCLGRRVAREILDRESLFDQPTADISLREYEIAVRSKTNGLLRTAVASAIEIELFPAISSKFRFQKAKDDTPRAFPSFDISKLRNALIEALTALDITDNQNRETELPLRQFYNKPSAKTNRGKKPR